MRSRAVLSAPRAISGGSVRRRPFVVAAVLTLASLAAAWAAVFLNGAGADWQ